LFSISRRSLSFIGWHPVCSVLFYISLSKVLFVSEERVNPLSDSLFWPKEESS
jgi:hypothetical protein